MNDSDKEKAREEATNLLMDKGETYACPREYSNEANPG
jgi:hypothetical protein